MDVKNFDRWAKVYDLLYTKYKEDIEFYKREAKKVKGKVLEIACGTGRIYLELLKEGVDAYGVDISEEMLKVLMKKAKAQKLKAKVYMGDMREFKLKYKFPLIIVPFRSFIHNLTIDDQLKALKNFKEHLLHGGKLILNLFFPNPEIISKEYGKDLKDMIKTKEGEFCSINKTYFIDEPNQIIEFVKTLVKDNKVIWKEKFRAAFIYKREFELLLRLAGFKNWKVYGGFDYQPLKSRRQEMVWIIDK